MTNNNPFVKILAKTDKLTFYEVSIPVSSKMRETNKPSAKELENIIDAEISKIVGYEEHDIYVKEFGIRDEYERLIKLVIIGNTNNV